MKILTYGEWLAANEDLVDEYLDENIHPSGVPLRVLIEIGAEDARAMFDAHIRPLYDAQRKKDEEKLRAWEAVCR